MVHKIFRIHDSILAFVIVFDQVKVRKYFHIRKKSIQFYTQLFIFLFQVSFSLVFRYLFVCISGYTIFNNFGYLSDISDEANGIHSALLYGLCHRHISLHCLHCPGT